MRAREAFLIDQPAWARLEWNEATTGFDGPRLMEAARLAASWGLLLTGDGKGAFAPVRATASGFMIPGQARDIRRLRTKGGAMVVVARNDDRPLAFRVEPRTAQPAPPAPRVVASNAAANTPTRP